MEKAAESGGIMKNGIRRIRLHVEKTSGTIYCAEIYCTDKGKKAGQWQCEIIANYHAHQKTFIPT